jgi:hypothetical protein
MLRTLFQILIPVFVWGSLGLWGLALSALLRSREDLVVLTPGIVFRAIACGPIAFFVNWRKALRSDETRVRKHGQE